MISQQAFNAATTATSGSASGSFKTPLGILSKLIDSLLTHCRFALGFKTEKVISISKYDSQFGRFKWAIPCLFLISLKHNLVLTMTAPRTSGVKNTICSTNSNIYSQPLTYSISCLNHDKLKLLIKWNRLLKLHSTLWPFESFCTPIKSKMWAVCKCARETTDQCGQILEILPLWQFKNKTLAKFWWFI